MRRADREITDPAQVTALLTRERVLYLAMCDDGVPYVLPLSYGYDGDKALYLHSAPAGRKVEVLRRHPRVCFAIAPDQELTKGEVSCGWGLKYRSVVGEGIVHFVEDEAEKRGGLDVLMRQHGGTGGDYKPENLAQTTLLRIEIISLSGKQSGYS
jgi:nitroimidazol reductase NimA-like FMN-containing flavoprotein (pyridoxamine 5'-phosphate oxidase superfamily)